MLEALSFILEHCHHISHTPSHATAAIVGISSPSSLQYFTKAWQIKRVLVDYGEDLTGALISSHYVAIKVARVVHIVNTLAIALIPVFASTDAGRFKLWRRHVLTAD